jgi:Raf kinase inhibitor-like YbhB/YbcL family protein
MKKHLAVLSVMVLFGVNWAVAADFSLTSPQLKEGGRLTESQVFNGFGCEGKNISPALQWKNAPKETKSFAVTVYDPDAPTGSGWWHWVIFNIPADVNSLPENAGKPDAGLAPKGSIQSMTDFGKPGFGGACPPKGDKPHRYIFTVHALKVDKLPLEPAAPAAMVGFFLNQNSLGKATLTANYSREK